LLNVQPRRVSVGVGTFRSSTVEETPGEAAIIEDRFKHEITRTTAVQAADVSNLLK